MHDPAWEKPMDPDAPRPFSLQGWVDLAPFERTLGMAIRSASNGEAILTMPFTVKLAQGMGLMHGGAITSLADTAAAIAIKTLLAPDTRFATVRLQMRFLAPVTRGTITARAAADTAKGKERTFLGRVQVVDEEGKTVAKFSSEFRVARTR